MSIIICICRSGVTPALEYPLGYDVLGVNYIDVPVYDKKERASVVGILDSFFSSAKSKGVRNSKTEAADQGLVSVTISPAKVSSDPHTSAKSANTDAGGRSRSSSPAANSNDNKTPANMPSETHTSSKSTNIDVAGKSRPSSAAASSSKTSPKSGTEVIGKVRSQTTSPAANSSVKKTSPKPGSNVHTSAKSNNSEVVGKPRSPTNPTVSLGGSKTSPKPVLEPHTSVKGVTSEGAGKTRPLTASSAANPTGDKSSPVKSTKADNISKASPTKKSPTPQSDSTDKRRAQTATKHSSTSPKTHSLSPPPLRALSSVDKAKNAPHPPTTPLTNLICKETKGGNMKSTSGIVSPAVSALKEFARANKPGGKLDTYKKRSQDNVEKFLKEERSGSDESIKNQKMRYAVYKELVDTEVMYIKALGMLVNIYLQQLRESNLVTEDFLRDVFANIDILENYNKVLLSDLERALIEPNDVDVAKVGESFIMMKPFFKTYANYCNNYIPATEKLNAAVSTNKKLGLFLDHVRRH